MIAPKPATADHLACYEDVDVALDTYPYGGTTTTCEALWMGVPVITLAGVTHRSRVGATILRCLGLDELVAGSAAEYIERCVSLAGDYERRRELRSNLRERMRNSDLMNARQFTRRPEGAYRTMWLEFCRGGLSA